MTNPKCLNRSLTRLEMVNSWPSMLGFWCRFCFLLILLKKSKISIPTVVEYANSCDQSFYGMRQPPWGLAYCDHANGYACLLQSHPCCVKRFVFSPHYGQALFFEIFGFGIFLVLARSLVNSTQIQILARHCFVGKAGISVRFNQSRPNK